MIAAIDLTDGPMTDTFCAFPSPLLTSRLFIFDHVRCVVGADERNAIREVIDHGNGRSPLTRELLSRDVYCNFMMRRCIDRWHDTRAKRLARMPAIRVHARVAGASAVLAIVLAYLMCGHGLS